MEIIIFTIVCLGLMVGHWFITYVLGQPERDAKLLASITPEEASKIEAIITGTSVKEISDTLKWAFMEEEQIEVTIEMERFNAHEVWVVYYITENAVVINGLAYEKDGIWHLAPSMLLRDRLTLLLSRIICEKWRT